MNWDKFEFVQFWLRTVLNSDGLELEQFWDQTVLNGKSLKLVDSPHSKLSQLKTVRIQNSPNSKLSQFKIVLIQNCPSSKPSPNSRPQFRTRTSVVSERCTTPYQGQWKPVRGQGDAWIPVWNVKLIHINSAFWVYMRLSINNLCEIHGISVDIFMISLWNWEKSQTNIHVHTCTGI